MCFLNVNIYLCNCSDSSSKVKLLWKWLSTLIPEISMLMILNVFLDLMLPFSGNFVRNIIDFQSVFQLLAIRKFGEDKLSLEEERANFLLVHNGM